MSGIGDETALFFVAFRYGFYDSSGKQKDQHQYSCHAQKGDKNAGQGKAVKAFQASAAVQKKYHGSVGRVLNCIPVYILKAASPAGSDDLSGIIQCLVLLDCGDPFHICGDELPCICQTYRKKTGFKGKLRRALKRTGLQGEHPSVACKHGQSPVCLHGEMAVADRHAEAYNKKEYSKK